MHVYDIFIYTIIYIRMIIHMHIDIQCSERIIIAMAYCLSSLTYVLI